METYVDRWKRQKAEKEKLTQKKRKNSQKKADADRQKGEVENEQNTRGEGQKAEEAEK